MVGGGNDYLLLSNERSGEIINNGTVEEHVPLLVLGGWAGGVGSQSV